MLIRSRSWSLISKRRRAISIGYSLIELVISMTGGAIVFCLAISTIQQTMKLSQESDARAEHQSTVARLGQQLRREIHQSSEYQLETDATSMLTLKNANEPSTVSYKVDGSSVIREAKSPDSDVIARETYRLDKRSRVRIEATDDQHISLLILRESPDGIQMLEDRMVARVGRLLPLQSIKKGE